MKMHGLNNNLIYKTLLCIERDNSSRIPRSKTPNPMYKDNQNEKVMRKTPPKNSTPDRFPVIPQALNSHYRDPRRLNKHQIPPNNHQTQQTSKEGDVRDCSRKQSVCTQLAEGQPTYIRDCQAKNHVYVSKTKPGKGEG
jgi:hypothetical protein